MVPASLAGATPCSSPATMNSASTGSTAPFMVIDTVMSARVDAVEQRAHVVDGIDRHAGHADVAAHARVVAVVAAVGGEIEGDGEALLPGGDVAPVEGVGVLRRGEAGVLADGPRLRDVHGRIGPAQEGRDARIAVEEVEAGGVGGGIGLLDGDAFGREPGVGRHGGQTPCLDPWRRDRSRVGMGSDPVLHLREIRYPAHPRRLLAASRPCTDESNEISTAKPGSWRLRGAGLLIK